MLWETSGILKYFGRNAKKLQMLSTHPLHLPVEWQRLRTFWYLWEGYLEGFMPLISDFFVFRNFFLESVRTFWIHLHMKQRVAFLKSSLSSSVMSISLFSCILSYVPSLISLMFIAENTDSISSPLQKKTCLALSTALTECSMKPHGLCSW